MDIFNFSIPITVRIGDINYGNHVGYQNYLLYFQDARIAYLGQFGFSERDIAGYPMMVSAVECNYKRELRLGDELTVGCRVSKIRKKAFTMEYQILKSDLLCAVGTTTNLCCDFTSRKVVQLPTPFLEAIKSFEGETVC